MRRLALAACAWCASAGAHAANVAPGGYAWSENAGWLGFAPIGTPACESAR